MTTIKQNGMNLCFPYIKFTLMLFNCYKKFFCEGIIVVATICIYVFNEILSNNVQWKTHH